MNKVFVIMEYERYEGGDVVAIHASLESAIAAVRKIIAEDSWHKTLQWKEQSRFWSSRGGVIFHSDKGIDSFHIEEWEIVGS